MFYVWGTVCIGHCPMLGVFYETCPMLGLSYGSKTHAKGNAMGTYPVRNNITGACLMLGVQ